MNPVSSPLVTPTTVRSSESENFTEKKLPPPRLVDNRNSPFPNYASVLANNNLKSRQMYENVAQNLDFRLLLAGTEAKFGMGYYKTMIQLRSKSTYSTSRGIYRNKTNPPRPQMRCGIHSKIIYKQ